jgi:predicted PurR-regulated permease PerM
VANVNESTEKIQQAAGKAAGIPGADEFPTVVVRSRSVSEILFAHTQGFVIGLLITSVLLYYFLAAPDDFLERLLGLAPRLDDKKRLVAAMREIQTEVSRYLLTISMINLALGAVVAAALVALGVPNAALWGVLAAVANFVPYVGAIVFGLVLAGVGILSFDGPLHMLLPAGVFSVLHLLESYVVTPFVLGRRLTLSPVAVFVWVLFWSWLWGIPGGLIAVPLLAALKISLQHVPPLVPYARLIG